MKNNYKCTVEELNQRNLTLVENHKSDIESTEKNNKEAI